MTTTYSLTLMTYSRRPWYRASVSRTLRDPATGKSPASEVVWCASLARSGSSPRAAMEAALEAWEELYPSEDLRDGDGG